MLLRFPKLMWRSHKKVIQQIMIEFHNSNERNLMAHISYAQFVTVVSIEDQFQDLKWVNILFHCNDYLLKNCHLMRKCMFAKRAI